MSLCFGLATGSRPPLIAMGLLIVPVYLAVRSTVPARPLLAALAGPLAACVLLLLAYNYARFGNPLEVGQSYNLASYNPQDAHFGSAAYIPPNLWYYGLSPPRPTILFPFLALSPPPLTYPLGVPAGYGTPEFTGGLLTMTPLLLFAFALPWLYRRRPQSVRPLASPLLVAAGAGLFGLLFLSYEFYNSTERYETDFVAVFLFAALAAWFALSSGAPSRRRRAVRIVGAVLALWGCLAGVAISFTGYNNRLQTEHPGTWATLEERHLAGLHGHSDARWTPYPRGGAGAKVAGTSRARDLTRAPDEPGTGTESFSLPVGTTAQLTIVSPDRREAAIVSTMIVGAIGRGGAIVRSGATLLVEVTDASAAPRDYRIRGAGPVRVPIELNRGLNRVFVTPSETVTSTSNRVAPESEQLLDVRSLTIAGRY